MFHVHHMKTIRPSLGRSTLSVMKLVCCIKNTFESGTDLGLSNTDPQPLFLSFPTNSPSRPLLSSLLTFSHTLFLSPLHLSLSLPLPLFLHLPIPLPLSLPPYLLPSPHPPTPPSIPNSLSLSLSLSLSFFPTLVRSFIHQTFSLILITTVDGRIPGLYKNQRC